MVLSCCPLAVPQAWAQVAAPVPLSFAAANGQLEGFSAALSGSDHAVAAAREALAAVKTLRRPIVTASAQYLEYQKTLSVNLTETKQDALGATQNALAGLPGSFPPEYQEIAGELTGKLSQALPGLFSAIPDELSYTYRQTLFRPTVQAALPLYTGGAIPAMQDVSRAGVSLAIAKADQTRDLARINLIRVYFGELAALSLEQSAGLTRDALASVLGDAGKLHAAGVIAQVQLLQARVARDTAERAFQRATMAREAADDELADTLGLVAVRPTTPLFVDARPLAPVDAFLGRLGQEAQTRQAEAARDIAGAGVDLARSRYRPQVFAFGEYNFNRDNALPTEPDWIVGIGARITLLSNLDRGHSLAAARAAQAAAQDAAREARTTATIATHRAWDMAEGARRSFLLLDSSIAAAEENLRAQRVSFNEGEATVTDVVGAEAVLATARSQRIATAYEYDLALAGLLATANQLGSYSDYMAKATIHIAPEPAP